MKPYFILFLFVKGDKTATIGDGGSNVWIISDDENVDEKENEASMDGENMDVLNAKSNTLNHGRTNYIELDGMTFAMHVETWQTICNVSCL